jgi:hypothetical protein
MIVINTYTLDSWAHPGGISHGQNTCAYEDEEMIVTIKLHTNCKTALQFEGF